MDGVSNLLSGLNASLKSGATRKCKVSIEFRIDVFRYLFRNSGTKPCFGLGKLYHKDDFFEKFFPSHWDICMIIWETGVKLITL